MKNTIEEKILELGKSKAVAGAESLKKEDSESLTLRELKSLF
jgi:SNF2 family DNA or RNA helicase